MKKAVLCLALALSVATGAAAAYPTLPGVLAGVSHALVAQLKAWGLFEAAETQQYIALPDQQGQSGHAQ